MSWRERFGMSGPPLPRGAAGETLALVTDTPLAHPHPFDLDDAASLARFLAARLATLRRY